MNDESRRAIPGGSAVRETALPGVGVRYEFMTENGERLAVVHHRTGRRELVLYERADPDCARDSIQLGEGDSRTLAEILGGGGVVRDLARLQQSIEGLALDWLPLPPQSGYAGGRIGATEARTRTGVSIVAVLRANEAFPAPGPEFVLDPGDTLVVVGTPEGIEALRALLRGG